MMATTENGSDKVNIIMPEKKDRNNDSTLNIIAIAVIVAVVVAVAALIVSVIGISKQSNIVVNSSGASTNDGAGDSITVLGSDSASATSGVGRIWRFHIGHFGGNTQYLDEESGQVRGYDVDIVNKVCQIANKNCVIIWDVYENCWDSQAGQRARGGDGLMGNWYDASIGWLQTRPRSQTYGYTNDIGKAYPVGLFVKMGRTLAGYPSLSGVKIGILDGWYADEHCLVRYDHIRNFDETNANLIVHFPTEGALVDALVNNQIDAAFTARVPSLLELNTISLYQVGDFAVNECVIGGVSIMMPKANAELSGWFNPALDRLVATKDYDDLCQDLTISHGGRPGYAPEDYCIA